MADSRQVPARSAVTIAGTVKFIRLNLEANFKVKICEHTKVYCAHIKSERPRNWTGFYSYLQRERERERERETAKSTKTLAEASASSVSESQTATTKDNNYTDALKLNRLN